ncbi:MAG: hypothetical protein M1823_000668 [Watsoniomyces obsoletus]|nr:MAG: hypothetical protein M1823_000668 [Watsoniomyces obsoletus]
MHYNVTHLRRQAFYALPQSDWQLLAAPPISYLDTLIAVDEGIEANGRIASGILSAALSSLNLPSNAPTSSHISKQNHSLDWHGHATPNDNDKAQTIIRQLYRDWSVEGAPERNSCNDPVLEDLALEFPVSNGDINRNDIKILIPGAGLGRLVFEICARGFQAEGNEISFHALFTSSYILNSLPPGGSGSYQMDLYPWISTFSNRISRNDQLRKVKIPDVHPGTELESASEGQKIHAFQRMSMTASDFTLLYGGDGNKEKFNAVCTVFFIDTAPNLLRYVETIRNCLKHGGLWINVGPLLWHFHPNLGDDGHGRNEDILDGEDGEDGVGNKDGRRENGKGNNNNNNKREDRGIAEPGSVELTNEEVLSLVEQSGFTIEKQEIIEAGGGYISDDTSLFVQRYRLSHWVARRNR